MKAKKGLLESDSVNQKLLEKVKAEVGNRTGAHGLDHFMRVRKYAVYIAKKEGANVKIVEAMAFLHDLVRYEDEREEYSVEETIKKATEVLANLKQFSDADAKVILDGIRSHSLHSKIEAIPGSLEAKVLFDADKLDSVGRVGIARWFITMASRNLTINQIAQIYIKTIKEQQLKMDGKLYTETGTRMIGKKLPWTLKFMEGLIKEIGVDT